MGYVIKNKKTNKYHAKGRLNGNLQDAFVYQRYPTNKIKALNEDWYVCEVEILLIKDPLDDKKCQKRLLEAYNEMWRKNKLIH